MERRPKRIVLMDDVMKSNVRPMPHLHVGDKIRFREKYGSFEGNRILKGIVEEEYDRFFVVRLMRKSVNCRYTILKVDLLTRETRIVKGDEEEFDFFEEEFEDAV